MLVSRFALALDDDQLRQLENLKKAHDEAILTDEEYAERKARILGQQALAKPDFICNFVDADATDGLELAHRFSTEAGITSVVREILDEAGLTLDPRS